MKNTRNEKQSGSRAQKSRKVIKYPSTSQKTHIVNIEQRNLLLESHEPKKAGHIYTNSCTGIELINTKSEQQIPQKIRIGHTVKLSIKAQEVKVDTSNQNYPHLL